jgi:hypothetical protein
LSAGDDDICSGIDRSRGDYRIEADRDDDVTNNVDGKRPDNVDGEAASYAFDLLQLCWFDLVHFEAERIDVEGECRCCGEQRNQQIVAVMTSPSRFPRPRYASGSTKRNSLDRHDCAAPHCDVPS